MSNPSDPPGKPPADENVVRKRMTAPQMRVPGVPSGEGAPVDDDIPAPRRQTSKSGLNVVRVQEAVEVTGNNLRPAFPPQRVQTQPPPARLPSSPSSPPPAPSPPPPLAMDLDDLLGPAPSAPPSPARPPVVAPAMPMGAPPPPPFGAMATGSMQRPTAPPPPASLSTGSLPRPPMAFDPPVEPSGSRPRATGAMSLDPPVTPEGSGPRPAATTTGTLRRPTGMMSLDPPVESSAPTRRPTGMMSLDPEIEGSASAKRPAAVTGSFNRPPPARVVTAPALQALGIADEPPPPPPRWPPPWLESAKAVLAPIAGLVTVLVVVVVIAISTVGDDGGPATFTKEQEQRLVALWLKHGSWGQARSDEVVGAVAEVGSSVVVPLMNRLGSRTPRFVVLREPDLARVAALPDGTVVVTTGALRRLESEAQLAAVLAHALAHLALGDVTKVLQADPGGKAARAALSTSNPQNAAGVLSSVVETPLGHEIQAMDIAIETLKAAGWSARAMHEAVTRLDAHDGHPATPWHGLHPLDPAAMHTLTQASTAGRTNVAEYRSRILDRVGQLGAPPAAAPATAAATAATTAAPATTAPVPPTATTTTTPATTTKP